MISAQVGWSLVRRGERRISVRDRGLAQQENESTMRSEIKKRFEQRELPAKLLDYF